MPDLNRKDMLRRMARMSAQTAAAALAAFGTVKALGLPEGSWAVISALFTVQQSVGGTLTAAVGRLIGVAIGTMLGVACAALIGVSPWQAALGLLITAAVMNGIAAKWPSTQFGVVAGAILLLVPEGSPADKAIERGITIGLGTIIGTLASLFVFPERAHLKAREHLGLAIRRCGDLLATGIGLMTGDRDGDLGTIHAEIRRELEAAATMAEQSVHPWLSFRAEAPEPDKLVRATERLWHTLIMIDRAEDGPLPAVPRERLSPALRGLAAASCAYLEGLGLTVTKGEPPPPPDAVQTHLRTLDEALERMREEGGTRPLPGAETERVFGLSLALRHLAGDVASLARIVGERP
jgi:uncharacterized membrane protein YccC